MNLFSLPLSALLLLTPPAVPVPPPLPTVLTVQEVHAHETLDLTKRHGNPTVNAGYADNILLYLHYLKGDTAGFLAPAGGARTPAADWERLRQPFTVSFTLEPGAVFAFHPDFLSEYKDRAVVTAATNLGRQDGYRFVDGLWGNGVCHLASFMNWVGSVSGLKVTSPVNHDFAPIFGVPKIYGTAIYYQTGQARANENQNLYLENPYPNPITITLSADDKKVEMLVVETVGWAVTER